jgi:predicted TIM-barrel fold metal-dependent hydrolase
MINDAHCHFFSTRFFAALGGQMAPPRPENPANEIPTQLNWQPPGTSEELADRWVNELDRHGVTRAAMMGSVPGDEDSIAVAIRRHPSRLVGMTMVDPTTSDVGPRVARAVGEDGLRCVCLFPAMHGYGLDHAGVDRVFAAVAAAGAAVFIHCGVLTIGVRRKLGLATRIDVRLGNPLAIVPLASSYPGVPVIIPHFGAGFFRETLMAADLCPNIHLDTSSSNGWLKYVPGLTLASVFRQTLDTLGPDRVLFGSDSSFFPRGWQQPLYETQASILADLAVDDGVCTRIMAGNFDRVFGAANL